MFKITILSRGGQGGKIGAEVFAESCLASYKFAQSSSKFGVERRGTPIEAYIRLDDKFINERGEIEKPDMIVVFDATLINKNTFNNLKANGQILINAPYLNSFIDYLPGFPFILTTVDADSIANEFRVKANEQLIINIIMLGAINDLVPRVKIDNLLKTIEEELPNKTSVNQKALEKNTIGAREANKLVKVWTKEEIHIVSENLKLRDKTTMKQFGPKQPDKTCNGCKICIEFCPKGIIYLNNDKKAVIDYNYCNNCCICVKVCPKGSIIGGNQ